MFWLARAIALGKSEVSFASRFPAKSGKMRRGFGVFALMFALCLALDVTRSHRISKCDCLGEEDVAKDRLRRRRAQIAAERGSQILGGGQRLVRGEYDDGFVADLVAEQRPHPYRGCSRSRLTRPSAGTAVSPSRKWGGRRNTLSSVLQAKAAA